MSDFAQLNEALASGAREIEVAGTLRGMPSVTLPPGVGMRGGELIFGAKGLRLTSGLGTLRLANVISYGQVYLAAEGSVRVGRIEADGVHVAEADTRGAG